MTAVAEEIENDDDDVDALAPALKPFIRWVGGKRKFAVDLAARCETLRAPTGRYFEPFLGSGAVALAMPNGLDMVLGDACKPVAYLWWWLQREPVAIVEYATAYGLDKTGDNWNTEEGYGELRSQHNVEPFSDESWIPSARFLWLQCASFNGVYRENRQDYFNVPYGHRKRVNVPSVETLVAVADHIRNADIRPGWDFEDVIAEATAGDVIFVDPPYDGDATAFTGYVATPFGPAEQERLCNVLEDAIGRGVSVVHTNADTPRIRKLYRHYTIAEVFEARRVAANPAKRTPAACLIMTKAGRW